MKTLAQTGGLDLFGQVVIAVVLSGIAYLTGNRVRKQDSGWERLVKVSQGQVSRMQKQIDELLVENRRLRREALSCPHPHLTVEQIAEG